MLPLTDEQREKVEMNIGLVGKVIHNCVHSLDKSCSFDYDDLFQIGCIGLCKAVQTDRPGYKGAFSTYAYLLIRNEIYTQLEHATRQSRELATDPMEMPNPIADDSSIENIVSCSDTKKLLDWAETVASGVTRKGVQAIRLLAMGYNNREIGDRFGVPANHVTAWVAKARKLIMQQAQQ